MTSYWRLAWFPCPVYCDILLTSCLVSVPRLLWHPIDVLLGFRAPFTVTSYWRLAWFPCPVYCDILLTSCLVSVPRLLWHPIDVLLGFRAPFTVTSYWRLAWFPRPVYGGILLTSCLISLHYSYSYINIIWFCSDWLAMSNSCYNPFIYGLLNVSNSKDTSTTEMTIKSKQRLSIICAELYSQGWAGMGCLKLDCLLVFLLVRKCRKSLAFVNQLFPREGERDAHTQRIKVTFSDLEVLRYWHWRTHSKSTLQKSQWYPVWRRMLRGATIRETAWNCMVWCWLHIKLIPPPVSHPLLTACFPLRAADNTRIIMERGWGHYTLYF